ncbi:hypothetical protein [Cohnella sp. WQ 127256]|uniref:hypothetical protein n=1 Tax=Cohnella sp. WQ 127256 TaxID=2938790 RepID=UPI002118AFB6|nr:hypothetical protein [Cohnella sp. WQ 127256]
MGFYAGENHASDRITRTNGAKTVCVIHCKLKEWRTGGQLDEAGSGECRRIIGGTGKTSHRLGSDEEPRLAGADGRWSEGVLHIWITLPPLHPGVIGIGECVGELSALSSFTQIDRPILDHP